jgi:DNA-binding transcriptional regulator YdaS (Cro superfamily)
VNLIDYVKQQDGTCTIQCPVLAGIAERAECSHATLYMIALGHKKAGPMLARAIEQATGGAVSRYVLRPDVFGPGPAAAQDKAA